MNQNDISIVQRAIDCIHSAKLCEFNSMSSRREQLRLMDEAIAALRSALQKGCDHCNHPMYAGIRCGVCGRWTEIVADGEGA